MSVRGLLPFRVFIRVTLRAALRANEVREDDIVTVGALVGCARKCGCDPGCAADRRAARKHERNRCKRVTREALRLMHPTLAQGYDVVVIIRGGIGELTGRDVAERSLGEIFRKTGLLARER